MRLLFFGWAGLMLACLFGIPLSEEAAGGFGIGMVLIRPWMWIYNQLLLAVHLVWLAALFLGVLFTRDLWRPNRHGAAGWGAALFWGATIVSVVAMILFPLAGKPGPWLPDALEVRLVRVLVFLPGVLRGAGLGLMVLALGGSGTAPLLRLRVPLLILVFLDLALAIRVWASTPKAVFARFHPYSDEPVFTVPWFVGGLLFLWLLKRLTPEKR